MRGYGTIHPSESGPIPVDTVQCLILAAAGVGQAMDWPNSTGGAAAAASSAPCAIARFTGQLWSTSNTPLMFAVNLYSTGAIVPTSGTSFNSSNGVSHLVNGQGTFQIPGNSTGWSAIAQSSGMISVEIWKK